MDLGCTRPAGWLPALMAFMPLGANALNVASASMERQELPVHKNSMFIHYFQKLISLIPMFTTIDDRYHRQHHRHFN
jgi:hypothetical protein